MDNPELSHSMELIRQAKELGLLNSNLTIRCIHCNAIFPNDYNKCPKCNSNQT